MDLKSDFIYRRYFTETPDEKNETNEEQLPEELEFDDESN
jgi:hypothetical protein